MIITTIKIHGRSEKRKEIMQTITALAKQLLKYRGCLKAELYQDLDDKNILYFVEEWMNRNDLEKYKSSRSLAVLKGATTLLSESLEIQHAVKVTRCKMQHMVATSGAISHHYDGTCRRRIKLMFHQGQSQQKEGDDE